MTQVKMTKLNRKIIIIKGFSTNAEELKIDRQYVEYYKKFFCHNAGGAYENTEIEILGNEDIITAAYLKSYFKDKLFDFVIVILLGHGATQCDYQLFKLNDNEIVKPGQIEINSEKQLIILESCRNIIPSNIPTINLSDKIPSFKPGGKFRRPTSRQDTRYLYDNQIIRCRTGKVICFACSKDESAYGYFFSNVLIRCAFNWHLSINNHEAVLKIPDLMYGVTPVVNKLAVANSTEPQTPQIVGDIDFPFAVSKF